MELSAIDIPDAVMKMRQNIESLCILDSDMMPLVLVSSQHHQSGIGSELLKMGLALLFSSKC